LCIDEASSAITTGNDNPFFENGEPTDLTQKALDFCRAFQDAHTLTQEFTRALVEVDILVENQANIALESGEKLSMAGFRIIDEARFNALPNATFLEWRKRGWLPLVHCHLMSTANWSSLIEREERRLHFATSQAADA
jgi:hypothetical protein